MRGDRAPFNPSLPRVFVTPLQGARKSVPPQLAIIDIHCRWLKVLNDLKRNCRVDFSPGIQAAGRPQAAANPYRSGPTQPRYFEPNNRTSLVHRSHCIEEAKAARSPPD